MKAKVINSELTSKEGYRPSIDNLIGKAFDVVREVDDGYDVMVDGQELFLGHEEVEVIQKEYFNYKDVLNVALIYLGIPEEDISDYRPYVGEKSIILWLKNGAKLKFSFSKDGINCETIKEKEINEYFGINRDKIEDNKEGNVIIKNISRHRAIELGYIVEDLENKENFSMCLDKHSVTDHLIKRTIEKEFTVVKDIQPTIDNHICNKNKHCEVKFKVYDSKNDRFHDAYIKIYYDNSYEESGEIIHGTYKRRFKVENVKYVKVESFNYNLKLEPIDFVL